MWEEARRSILRWYLRICVKVGAYCENTHTGSPLAEIIFANTNYISMLSVTVQN
jgi:hypothetical protein